MGQRKGICLKRNEWAMEKMEERRKTDKNSFKVHKYRKTVAGVI